MDPKRMGDMEFTRHETVRVKLNNRMSREDSFEYGEYKYTGIQRWCHNARQSRWYGMRIFGEAVMYTRNLKRELRGTGLERLALKDYMRGDRGGVCPSGKYPEKMPWSTRV